MSEWPMVKLGEVCSISIGKTPARKKAYSTAGNTHLHKQVENQKEHAI